jgi:flagellar FliL protein
MSGKNVKKKGLSKIVIVIMILLLLIIVGGGAFGAYYFLVLSKSNSKTTTAVTITPAQETTYSLDEQTLNLADTNAQKYLDVIVSFGYDKTNSALTAELADTTVLKKPIITDAVLNVLRSKKSTDFQDPALKSIKQEILNAVNPILTNGKFIDVYFDKIVIE